MEAAEAAAASAPCARIPGDAQCSAQPEPVRIGRGLAGATPVQVSRSAGSRYWIMGNIWVGVAGVEHVEPAASARRPR